MALSIPNEANNANDHTLLNAKGMYTKIREYSAAYDRKTRDTQPQLI